MVVEQLTQAYKEYKNPEYLLYAKKVIESWYKNFCICQSLKVGSLLILREVLKIGNHVAHFLCDQTIEKWLNFKLSNTTFLSRATEAINGAIMIMEPFFVTLS